MQEEVESRTVNLAITTTKLTMRTIIHAGMMYLRHRKLVKDLKKDEVPSGKQSVQELIGQKQGVSSIDIAKTDLRGFEGVARKYGVDYAIRKDASVDPPKYLVFFKAKDADALTAALCGLWYLVLLSGNPKWRDTALSRFLYASGVSNMIAL